MSLDSFADLKSWVLDRCDEETDASSDWDSTVSNDLITVWRDLMTRHPWLSLMKDPPGVLLMVAPITTLTLTVAAPGTAVAGTLSAAPSGGVSIAGRKVIPTGKSWAARVTVHAAGGTAVTLDAAPETLAAVGCTIFQDEYDIASDVALFADNGMWTQEGNFVELWEKTRVLAEYPDPPSASWPPKAFFRVSKTKVRFSTYPTAIKRLEYPYTAMLSDPSGSAALSIDSHLRPLLGHGGSVYLFEHKGDRRMTKAQADYERGIELAISFEQRMKTGVGHYPGGQSVYSPTYGN